MNKTKMLSFLLIFNLLLIIPLTVFAEWYTQPDQRYEFKPMYLRDVYWVGPEDPKTERTNMCWYERDINNGKLTGQTVCGVPNAICRQLGSMSPGDEVCPSNKSVCVYPDPNTFYTVAVAAVSRYCAAISSKVYTIDNPAAQAAKLTGKEIPPGTPLSGAGYSCVTGQSCEAVYDPNGNVVDLIFYVDKNLAAGTSLSLNGRQCNHLISCQKMLAGSVWPYGVISMKTLLSPPPPAEVAKTLPLPTANSAPQALSYWVQGNGTVPAGAVEIGTQADGAKNYICLVNYSNAVVTGKLQWGNTCFFGWFGKELSLKQGYEVLINTADVNLTWRPWNGGADWDVGSGGNRKGLISGNYNGKPIVPCRSNFKGGVVGGHFHGNTCFLPYYNVENPVGTFELLGY